MRTVRIIGRIGRTTETFFNILAFGALSILLAGCFQTAGNTVEPTIALLTATAVAPPVIPTVEPLPATVAPVASPEQPATQPTNPPALAPTFTPFITPIGDQGFQTPVPTNPPSPDQPTATVPLFPPTTPPTPGTPDPNAPIPTIAAPTVDPNNMSTPTALPTDPPCTYTVQSGDTFYAIGRKLNLKPEDLIAANPRPNTAALNIGEVLNVPGCNKATATVAGGPTAAPGQPQLYNIVSGDTLGRIASRFGVTVQELVRANNFPNENVILRVGQQIVIPPKP